MYRSDIPLTISSSSSNIIISISLPNQPTATMPWVVHFPWAMARRPVSQDPPLMPPSPAPPCISLRNQVQTKPLPPALHRATPAAAALQPIYHPYRPPACDTAASSAAVAAAAALAPVAAVQPPIHLIAPTLAFPASLPAHRILPAYFPPHRCLPVLTAITAVVDPRMPWTHLAPQYVTPPRRIRIAPTHPTRAASPAATQPPLLPRPEPVAMIHPT